MDGTSIIKFGKYKDKTIEQIPNSYLNWLLEQEWFCVDYKGLVEEIGIELKYREDFDKQF